MTHHAQPALNIATPTPETSEAVSRLIVILTHQQQIDLPAIASARRGRDTVLVDGDLDEDFARDLRARGHRLVQEQDAVLETRIARALYYYSKRRITITKPGDVTLYRRIEAWAAKFGVSVDIYFETLSETEHRAAA